MAIELWNGWVLKREPMRSSGRTEEVVRIVTSPLLGRLQLTSQVLEGIFSSNHDGQGPGWPHIVSNLIVMFGYLRVTCFLKAASYDVNDRQRHTLGS